MKLLFNELSIDGQFHDLKAFRRAVEMIMSIRNATRQFGWELQCHQNVSDTLVMPGYPMKKAVNTLTKEKRRDFLQWLTHRGSLWNNEQRHSGDDYMACDDKIVTDTAVGEAAYLCFHGILCHIVSMNPSEWMYSPVKVDWHNIETLESIDVCNHWNADEAENAFRSVPAQPLDSWGQLETTAKNICRNLTFSPECFTPLQDIPFNKSAAEQLLQRLTTLRDFKNSIDNKGKRTEKGQKIYQMHFTGDNAWFSDSSRTEKSRFRNDMTFPHPELGGNTLFCTWHGKVKTTHIPLRIHFSWPMQSHEKTYVVYVGQKITKK